MDSLDSCRLYVLQQRGPLSFIVKRDGEKGKHRVMIGEKQSCSCHQDNTKLCQHLFFVMIKVLRVSRDNPLVWQLSLVDREIGDILAGKYTKRTRETKPLAFRKKEAQTSKAERRQIISGEPCPICYSEMEEDNEAIVFCDVKCGRGIHAKCMQVWAQHRMEEREPISCPLCRSDWGADSMQQISKVLFDWEKGKRNDAATSGPGQESQLKPASKPVCSQCRRTIFYQRYRCVVCKVHNLCQSCYHSYTRKAKNKMSLKHVFVKRKEDQKDMVPGPWTGPPKKKQDTREIARALLQMQTREISTSDYELLLRLDRGSKDMPAYEYLAWHGLPQADPDPLSSCNICNLPLVANQGDTLKLLPCGHSVHARCLLGELMYDISKPCGTCNEPIFPGLLPSNLSLRVKRKKPKAKPKIPLHSHPLKGQPLCRLSPFSSSLSTSTTTTTPSAPAAKAHPPSLLRGPRNDLLQMVSIHGQCITRTSESKRSRSYGRAQTSSLPEIKSAGGTRLRTRSLQPARLHPRPQAARKASTPPLPHITSSGRQRTSSAVRPGLQSQNGRHVALEIGTPSRARPSHVARTIPANRTRIKRGNSRRRNNDSAYAHTQRNTEGGRGRPPGVISIVGRTCTEETNGNGSRG